MTDRNGEFTLREDGAEVQHVVDFERFKELGKWEVAELCDHYFKRILTDQQMIEFARHILKLCNEEPRHQRTRVKRLTD